MRRNWSPSARSFAGALVFFVSATAAAPPAAAAGAQTPARSATLAAAAEARVAALEPAAVLAATQAPAAPAEGPEPFLKTPKGVIAVVLMAGVTAWLIQSRISNKVDSPGRQ